MVCMNARMARYRRTWPWRLATAVGGVLLLTVVVFGTAWLRHGSNPAVEELRAIIAAREQRPMEAPPHRDLEAARPHVAETPNRYSWDHLAAQTETDEEKAWREAWLSLTDIPIDERSEEDWQALAAMLEGQAEWIAAVAEMPAGDADLRDVLVIYWDKQDVAYSGHMVLLLRWSRLREEAMALRAHHGDHGAAFNLLLDTWERWQSVPHSLTRNVHLSYTAAHIAWLGLEAAAIAPEQVRRLVDVLGKADFQQGLANSLAHDAHEYLEAFRVIR